MSNLVETAAAAAAIAAGVAGVLYLSQLAARALLRAWGTLHGLAELVTHELEHNGGGSIKDDVVGIAVAVGQLQRQVDELLEQREDATAVHQLLQLQVDQLGQAIEQHHPTHKRERKQQ